MSSHTMNDIEILSKEAQPLADSARELTTNVYQTPVLISYGDVRDITLGGTLGQGESGAGFQFFSNIQP